MKIYGLFAALGGAALATLAPGVVHAQEHQHESTQPRTQGQQESMQPQMQGQQQLSDEQARVEAQAQILAQEQQRTTQPRAVDYTSPPTDQPMSSMRSSLFAPNMPEKHRPNLLTPFGVGATLGGGAVGFTGSRAKDFSDSGGGWNARLIVGTRSVIGGELAYIGSVQDVSAVGLDNSAKLLSNGGELLARVNLLPGMFQPYVVGGAGYTNYHLVNDDFNTSSVRNNDNVVNFPVGGGLAFRYDGLLIDARGTFRPTTGGDMFEDDASMNTWNANLNAGFEF